MLTSPLTWRSSLPELIEGRQRARSWDRASTKPSSACLGSTRRFRLVDRRGKLAHLVEVVPSAGRYAGIQTPA